jgi:hypothetical protein
MRPTRRAYIIAAVANWGLAVFALAQFDNNTGLIRYVEILACLGFGLLGNVMAERAWNRP